VQKIALRDLDAEMESDTEETHEMNCKLFEFEALVKEPNFGIKRYKNCLYKGQLVDRKREGLGVLLYATGRIYEGEWIRERRNGRGFELYPNGAKYIG
jgi:hypothetical protein